MKKKPKTIKGKHLAKKLDDLIRELFKTKYGANPTCFVCGHVDGWWNSKTCPRGIQVGHYIGRRKAVLRWSLLNVFPQCSSCNIVHNSNPTPFTLAIINDQSLGVKHIELLREITKKSLGDRVTDTQKRQLLEDLNEMLECYKH